MLFFVVALATASHYGIGWDNPGHYKVGPYMLEYVLGQKDCTIDGKDYYCLLVFSNIQYYGPLGDLISYFNYKLFHQGLNWLNEIPARHLHLYLFASLTLGLITWFGSEILQPTYGILAGILLFLHPIFLGFSHLAIKGVPMTFFFTLSMVCGYFWVETQDSNWFYGFCAATALGYAVKISALASIPILIVYRGLRIRAKPFDSRKFLKTLLKGGLIGWATCVLVWPYMWFNPLRIFEPMLYFVFKHSWTEKLLFMGEIYSKNTQPTPFYYTPVMLLIKTPGLQLFGVIGIGLAFLKQFVPEEDRSYLIWLTIVILVPIASSMYFSGSRYDADRQFLFLYPFIALLSAYGWVALSRWNRGLVSLGFVALCIYTLFRIYTLHPNEIVFYNNLVGQETGAAGEYELDYYGNVYRQGAEWLNKHAKPGDTVHVPLMGSLTLYFLDEDIGMNERHARDADWIMILPRAGYKPLKDKKPTKVIPRKDLPLLYIYKATGEMRQRDYHKYFRKDKSNSNDDQTGSTISDDS
ncbi:MAG: ArnT family glycosyltransferase [bacterium]